MSEARCFANSEPHIRENIVLRNTPSGFVHHAEIGLSVGISLRSREPIPLDRFFIVLRNTPSVCVHRTEVGLRVGVAFLSR